MPGKTFNKDLGQLTCHHLLYPCARHSDSQLFTSTKATPRVFSDPQEYSSSITSGDRIVGVTITQFPKHLN